MFNKPEHLIRPDRIIFWFVVCKSSVKQKWEDFKLSKSTREDNFPAWEKPFNLGPLYNGLLGQWIQGLNVCIKLK